MSRIVAKLSELRAAGRKALIPYLMAGDPSPTASVPLLHALVAAGADIIELGTPFSDPMADGAVIQRANERALAQQVNLTGTLAIAAEFRATDAHTPLVVMGYLNPIEAMGYPQFVAAAARAGVDAVLIVDMPPEEGGELAPMLRQAGIDTIFLLAPTTSDPRIRRIDSVAQGYLYYVSLKGVTGAANLDLAEVRQRVAHLRGLTTLPIMVGFGVRSAAHAAAVAGIADGVVVGSALIQLIEQRLTEPAAIQPALCDLLRAMRQAMDAVEATV